MRRADRLFSIVLELSPLMFTVAEVQALVLGGRMVEAWGDPRLRSAARSALRKVEAVLPPADRHRITDTALYALSFWMPDEPRQTLGVVREAVDRQRRLAITYARPDGETTERVIRPLALFFWGRTWTVAAWCELRADHRSFRVDRITGIETLADTFTHEPPVTLDDFIAAVADADV